MGDILSQNQIDSLIGSILSGELEKEVSKEEKGFIKYDFSRPKKFTRDDEKVLKGIFENYARIASLRFNSFLRVMSEFEVVSVEEQKYFEFNNILDENDIILIEKFRLENEKQVPVIYHVNQSLMLHMIDKSLGGTEIDNSLELIEYNYSEVELQLYQKIMENSKIAFMDALQNYVPIEFLDRRIEANHGLFQEISLDDTVIIIGVSIKFETVEGMLTICIPGKLLTYIIDGLLAYNARLEDEDENAVGSKERLFKKIQNSQVNVTALMPNTKINMEELYGLEIGDVLDLSIPINADLDVKIEDRLLLRGKMGVYQSCTAIQIESYVNNDKLEN